MSKENVEVVRRLTAGIAGGDPAAIRAVLDPAVEVDDQDIIDADDYRGPESFFRWIARWNESWQTWRLEHLEFLPAPDEQVVSLFLMVATGRGSGLEISRRDATVCTLRAGKVVKLGYYNDQSQALEAAGLDAGAAQAPAG